MKTLKFTQTLAILTLSLSSVMVHAGSPLQTLKDIATEISQQDSDSFGAYLSYDPSEVADAIGTSCSDPHDFHRTSSERVKNFLISDLSDGIDYLVDSGVMDKDDGYYSALESLQDSAVAYAKQIKGHIVEECIGGDSPVIHILKVDGRPALEFYSGMMD